MVSCKKNIDFNPFKLKKTNISDIFFTDRIKKKTFLKISVIPYQQKS